MLRVQESHYNCGKIKPKNKIGRMYVRGNLKSVNTIKGALKTARAFIDKPKKCAKPRIFTNLLELSIDYYKIYYTF